MLDTMTIDSLSMIFLRYTILNGLHISFSKHGHVIVA